MYVKKRIIYSIFLCFAFTYASGQDRTAPVKSKDSIKIKVDTLKPAVVTAKMRPHMKGDTLEYNVEHLAMQPNAEVEELLRGLPGLEVGSDGTIIYNGQKIQHLLVDGEDIFGSDPTLVTRTFDASKIARVQILEKKSDQAIFTGIDDGSRTKTLNLVLKESARNGYFGKGDAGGNSDGYYSAGGALAAFHDKEQFAAIGLAANTGVLGFSSNSGESPSSVSFVGTNSDPLNGSAGIGIPQFAAAAVHYSNRLSGSDNHLLGNYQFGHYQSQPFTNSINLQIEPDSVYGQLEQNHSVNQQDQHSANASYQWNVNSCSSLLFNIDINETKGRNQFSSITSSTFNDTLVNTGQRTIRDKVQQKGVGANVFYRIQTGKRSNNVLSMNVSASGSSTFTSGYLYSLNQFFQSNGDVESIDTIDQRKQITSSNFNYSAGVNYARPIASLAILGLSYKINVNNSHPFQGTYNKGEGDYTAIVDSLSSNLVSRILNQGGSINLEGPDKRLKYTIGADFLDYAYQQHDLITDSSLKQHYFTLSPRLQVGFTLNPAVSLNFKYDASTQEPSPSQLTPIVNNTNPLFVTMGNPSLRPSFNQEFEMGARWLGSWLESLDLQGTIANNCISTKMSTDSLGRQISEPVNVDGAKSIMANFGLNHRMLGMDWGLHLNENYTRAVNFVNTVINANDVYNTSAGFVVSKFVPNEFSLYIRTNFAYIDSRNSINTDIPLHYWIYDYSGTLDIYFLKNFTFNTNADYTWQQKTAASLPNMSILIWNGAIGRNFLNNVLTLKLVMNNILNQNAGVSRSNSINTYSQSTTKVLGRYWLFSAVYHFDRKFKLK